MNDLTTLTSLYRTGTISLDEPISLDELRERLAELAVAIALARADRRARTVDCGNFRLLLVPWQP